MIIDLEKRKELAHLIYEQNLTTEEDKKENYFDRDIGGCYYGYEKALKDVKNILDQFKEVDFKHVEVYLYNFINSTIKEY